MIPVDPRARHNDTRLCLAQKTHGGLHSDVWAVDSLRLMPVKPTNSDFHVQFSLHLTCGLNARRGANNRSACCDLTFVRLSFIGGYKTTCSVLLNHENE